MPPCPISTRNDCDHAVQVLNPKKCRPWQVRGTSVRAFCLNLLLVLCATGASAKEWSFLYKSDGIEVLTDRGSPPAFKAEGILDVDVVDILAIFADVPRRTEWVRYLSESRVVRDNQVDRVLVYNRYDLPWPASDRDSLIETEYTNDYKSGEATTRFRTVEEPGEPPRKGILRIPKADGMLYLKVLGEGKTFVRYELTLDPGGWLPQWICNIFVRDAPIELLQLMKRRIGETKDSYKPFKERLKPLWHADSHE